MTDSTEALTNQATEQLTVKSLKETITQILPSNRKKYKPPPAPSKGIPVGAISSPLFLHCGPTPENKYDEVLPNIFLGDRDLACDKDGLQNLGITHILNAGQGKKFNQIDTDADYYSDIGIKFMGVRAVDFPNFKMQPHFTAAADYIADTMGDGGKLYIHCRQGLSRSATLLLAYMMIKQGIPLLEAVTTLRKIRPILPNDGFLKQLIQLNEELYSSNTTMNSSDEKKSGTRQKQNVEPKPQDCDNQKPVLDQRSCDDGKADPQDCDNQKPVLDQRSCDDGKADPNCATKCPELDQDKAGCDDSDITAQEICDSQNSLAVLNETNCDNKSNTRNENNTTNVCEKDKCDIVHVNDILSAEISSSKPEEAEHDQDEEAKLAVASGTSSCNKLSSCNDNNEIAAPGLKNDKVLSPFNDNGKEIASNETRPLTRKLKARIKLENQKPPSFTVDEIKKILRDVKPEPCFKTTNAKGKEQPRLLFVNRDLSGIVPCNRYDEVYPGIYLGDHLLTRNMAELKRLGITHIVNTAQGQKFTQIDTSEEYYADIGAKFFGIKAMDIHKFNMKKHFHEAADFIDEALKKEGKLYVHCHQGFSRSAAVTLAFLMIKRELHLVEAITVIRKRRAVMPNDGFLQQLIELEDTLWP